MNKNESYKNESKIFWEWISAHKDYVVVEFNGEDKCFLYIGFDEDTLNDFTEMWQYRIEERGTNCKIMMNCLCFKLFNIEGGFGFTMQELWNDRPKGIEDILGGMIF